MTAKTSPQMAAWAARVQPLFRGPFVPATGLSFLIFGGLVVVATVSLLAFGRVDLALPVAWTVTLVEVNLMATKKMRLKLPLTAILALLGAALILLCDLDLHSLFWH